MSVTTSSSSPVAWLGRRDRHPRSSTSRTVARIGLGLFLTGFGISHLTVAREGFRAQVPERVEQALPVSTDDIVLGSGIVEIGLGLAFLGLPRERFKVGLVLATFFVGIFPGNLSHLMKHADALGLDSDRKRWVRLLFQPVLVAWSLFGGGAI